MSVGGPTMHSEKGPTSQAVATIVGKSTWAMRIQADVQLVAAYDSGVLITGPTGTGKELIARAIHDLSPRAGGPFVTVDCGALPADLFVSHMFGHVKGAFTGAHHAALGVFRAADGGTIFLDEIGELEPHLQSKLLRVIQEKTVVPVGGHESLSVDVRIVAATNRHLGNELDRGGFRPDLFYRLNVVSLETVPLSERPEDIPILARHYLERIAVENGFPKKRITDDGLRRLAEYDWPGNVRELNHRLERAAIFTRGDEIGSEAFGDLPSITAPRESAANNGPSVATISDSSCEPFEGTNRRAEENGGDADEASWPSLTDVERRHILLTLEHTGFNQTAAARLLSMDRHSLRRKIRRYGIDLPVVQRGRPPKPNASNDGATTS